MKVVRLPKRLDERSFDRVIQAAHGGEGRALFDARGLEFVDPFGMLALLTVGRIAAKSGERPRLQLPESAEVSSYLGRMRFFEHASAIYEVHGAPRRGGGNESDVLLEITPVRSHVDVHAVVDRVHERASLILSRQLLYPVVEAVQFSIVLSEVCQNIIEHAESDGWVAVQTYNWAKRLGRRVAVIAVMDVGIGFKASLASAHAASFGEHWTDVTALECALRQGFTRFSDPGRGQGLRQIRRQVQRWGGKLSIRSGTARIAEVPPWDDAPALEQDLAPFPGTQICIVMPAREAPGPQGRTA